MTAETMNPGGFNELKLCRSGPMLYNKNDWPIGKSLQRYGECCWRELEVLEQIVWPGMVALDVGANIGTHTVRLSQLVKHGVVLAFEPQRLVFQTLCANLALNNCTNVYAFWRALGNRDGTITVPVRDPYAANNFGGVCLAGVREGDHVEVRKLDSIGLNACHFIKADIEGMEDEFLQGAQDTIAKHRPVLYIEADGAQYRESIERLFGWNYDCWWSLPALFNPDNFCNRRENVFMTEDGRAELLSVNMLCIPAESKTPVEGLVRVNSADDDALAIETQRRIEHNERLKRQAA